MGAWSMVWRAGWTWPGWGRTLKTVLAQAVGGAGRRKGRQVGAGRVSPATGAEQWGGGTPAVLLCRVEWPPALVCPAPGSCLPGARCVRQLQRKLGAMRLWPKIYWMRVLLPHSPVFPWGWPLARFQEACSEKPVSPKSIFFSLVGLLRPLELLELVPKGLSRTSCHSRRICCVSQSYGWSGRRWGFVLRLTSASHGHAGGGWGQSACGCPRVWSVCLTRARRLQLFHGHLSRRRQSGWTRSMRHCSPGSGCETEARRTQNWTPPMTGPSLPGAVSSSWVAASQLGAGQASGYAGATGTPLSSPAPSGVAPALCLAGQAPRSPGFREPECWAGGPTWAAGSGPSVRVGRAGVMRRGPQTCLPLPNCQAAPESQISQRSWCAG